MNENKNSLEHSIVKNVPHILVPALLTNIGDTLGSLNNIYKGRLKKMKVKVLGTRELDFPTPNGQTIEGLNIYISYSYDDVNGEMTDKVFISRKSDVKIPVFKFGQYYDFRYDGIGKRQRLVEICPVN